MNQAITFGSIVKERRHLLGLTQAELGRRVGCAPITIRKVEADALRPSVQIAEHLAVALNLPEEEHLAFIRLARAEREPSPLPTPQPLLEEIGQENLSGRAIRGFELGERIGAGGYGVVYRAVHTTVGREVAIKIILPQFADRPEFIRRFEAEAQLVAHLEHPHIVPLYDYWREPGVAYLVMRLLRGGSLETLLQAGPLAYEPLLHIMEQICAGLHAAHRDGVIHRDLKPANILLDEDGNAYLADFGIAKQIGHGYRAEATLEGTVIGSPAYISPEQILAEPVKPQADIYSLGVVLYELLTGRKPFKGPTSFAYIQQHLNEPLPLLAAAQANGEPSTPSTSSSHIRSGPVGQALPSALDIVIARATAKEPRDRYPDVLSLLGDLRRATAPGTTAADLAASKTLEKEAPHIATMLELPDLENPYKGLRPFTEADAADFFGRETLIQDLLARLTETNDLVRFLAVVGPSGSGKSSVVRAGLIPALRQGGLPGSENWFITEMLPGRHPFEEMEAALLRIAINPPESLLAQLHEDERGLLRAVRRILPADPDIELALVIDQFEELFTLVTDEDIRHRFLNSLVTAVLDPDSRLRVVITLRADFTDQPLRYVDVGELVRQRTEFVLPLTSDELEQAIVRPTERAGLSLEVGLAQTIIHEIGDQPGMLPLLQYALTELFEHRQGRALTLATYQESGGVKGALARRAEALYTGLDEAGQEITRQLFLRLVTLGEGTEDTRRRVLRAEVEALNNAGEHHRELPGAGGSKRAGEQEEIENRKSKIENLIDLFGKYRLLTFDRDPVTRGPTVEVAHEALLREWGRLREWLDASRNDIRMQRHLATATAEWREANRDTSFLLRGARLDQFAGWAEGTTLALTPAERAFLEASLADRATRRAEEEARRQHELETAQKLAETESRRAQEHAQAAQSLRWLAVGLALFLLAAIGAALLALRQTNRAEQEARLATARELAAAAVSNLAVDPERSILLALQAVTTTYAVDGTVLKEAAEALHQAIPASRLQFWLAGHTGVVMDAAFSPDGFRLATASQDGTAKVWDAVSGRELLTLTGHTAWVTGIAFSPDGLRLATASKDATAKVWDAASGQELLTLVGHTEWVNRVAFSPKSSRLATASDDGTAKIWDAATGRELLTLTGHTGEVWGVAFSPDGLRLATASQDGTARVWDVASGRELLTLTGHTFDVSAVAFNPQCASLPAGCGSQLATTGGDNSVRLWDATTGQEVANFSYPSRDVAFSPDGTRLATANLDSTVRVLDAATGNTLLALTGHTNEIRSVAYSPDGTRLASTSDDGTRIWDITPAGSKEWLTLAGHTTWLVFDVKFSPTGTRLATSGDDNTARIWDALTGQELFALAGHTDNVLDVDFNPDGTRLATVSYDKTAKVWDTRTGQELFTLTGHTNSLEGVAFSPDGTRLVTASWDKTAKVWDAATGRELLTLTGHTDGVDGVAFSPDGTRLATASYDKTVKVWDISTPLIADLNRDEGAGATINQPQLTLTGHSDWISRVTFSPDGTRLATASADRTAKVWDAATGRELLTLVGHEDEVYDVNFSPDGGRLATSGIDHTARVWDAASGQELLTLQGPNFFSDFSPDGTLLAIGGDQGTARVYVLPIEELVALARSRLTRTWTEAECRRFLHLQTCPSGEE